MNVLHRTQIYIEKDQIQRLRLEAKKDNLSVSEMIRRAIENFLKTREKNVDWDNDPITKAIGSIDIDTTDISINHDKYLYGQKEKS